MFYISCFLNNTFFKKLYLYSFIKLFFKTLHFSKMFYKTINRLGFMYLGFLIFVFKELRMKKKINSTTLENLSFLFMEVMPMHSSKSENREMKINCCFIEEERFSFYEIFYFCL